MRTKGRHREWLAAMGFLAPNFIGFLVFMAGPLVFSLVVSFTNWNLQRTIPLRFIWLGNYIELVQDKSFWLYLLNTIYLMLGMPVCIAGSLALALLLNQKLRGMTAYRTFFYLPTFTAGVALFILWKALYNPDFGPINAAIDAVLRVLHLEDEVSPPEWLQSTRNLAGLHVEEVTVTAKQWGIGARDALIIMGIWIFIGGNNMLLYLAALTNIPKELIEAAHIDGAGRWATFRHVIWPQLAPTTFFIVVMSFIGAFQGGFEQARVMTGGGPAG
ncbi:MAG: carbohydrate ABC transporter permease, partial [Planctomycetota bacterium]